MRSLRDSYVNFHNPADGKLDTMNCDVPSQKLIKIMWLQRVLTRKSLCIFLLLLTLSMTTVTQATKISQFEDLNTGHHYFVTASTSTLRVSRVKINSQNQPHNVQTIKFSPALIDFDLNCLPSYCYLAVLTRRNVELYTWQRTQFDLVARRDIFATPQAVKMFPINSAFYIAIAQEQLHLTNYGLSEEPAKFVGCAILKFVRGSESQLKYHQFIKLPFNPMVVHHLTAIGNNNLINRTHDRPVDAHYLSFSIQPIRWNEPIAEYPRPYSTFLWSPLNDYFWPFRLPQNIEVISPKLQHTIIKLPDSSSTSRLLNLSRSHSHDQAAQIESCFSQLQVILTDRELHAKKLIDENQSIWKSNRHHPDHSVAAALTNITAQVIVHGDVIVRGSLVESPQMTIVAPKTPEVMTIERVNKLVDIHSPALADNKLKQAWYKMKYILDKLSKAVKKAPVVQISSKVRLFGNIAANTVIFRGTGLSNSNVRLNGIPFRQLEHELVSLRGVQNIGAKVVFNGNVVADLLEIHGMINREYYLKDALDIKSNRVQVIDLQSSNQANFPRQAAALEFNSVESPLLVMSPNVTMNDIRLNDFILRDNRTQLIYGSKSFKQLSMGNLNLAHPGVLLNGFNISRLINEALHLFSPAGNEHQYVRGGQLIFRGPITANKLRINGLINEHINISSLIHDTVKIMDAGPQQIKGFKHFLNGLQVNRLITEGAINGVKMSHVFNLNSLPPVADYVRYKSGALSPIPITGRFNFNSTVVIRQNLNTGLINGIDVGARAIRRGPALMNSLSSQNSPSTGNSTQPARQIVRGMKYFSRPLRVVNQLRMLDPVQHQTTRQEAEINQTASQWIAPSINGFDLREINAAINKQMQNPSTIVVDNLIIRGNLNLNYNGPGRLTIGNYSSCPLHVLRDKLILGGNEDQYIRNPVRINSLRVPIVQLDPTSLNGMTFPEDFVFKSNVLVGGGGGDRKELQMEPVFGHKTFDHIQVAPSLYGPIAASYEYRQPIGPSVLTTPMGIQTSRPTPLMIQQNNNNIFVGSHATINNISYNELQSFIAHEKQKNSTGETVFQNLIVHGNIYAKRINGYEWPNDIMLKSISSRRAPVGSLNNYAYHKRIYSPLIFLNSTSMKVENQLVLRGPIQLKGKLNGVNLTDFSQHSATYGDKDLLTGGRPLRNKIFHGGITVTGHLRSQGTIDGVNIEEMKRRVIMVGPRGVKIPVLSQKVFMSDININAPIRMAYLNDLPIEHYMRRLNWNQINSTYGNHNNVIQIWGKKTITGTIIINRNLVVQGLINGLSFADLSAKAISLSPAYDQIQFNKTLTVEGNVFMDNLIIDEKDGVIDHMKLTNLLPIDAIQKNELIIKRPFVNLTETAQPYRLNVGGQVHDCQISCSLEPKQQVTIPVDLYQRASEDIYRPPMQYAPLVMPPQHQAANYPPRKIQYNGQNVTYMRTTPPYVMNSPPIQQVTVRPPKFQYSPPFQPNQQQQQFRQPHKLVKRASYPNQQMLLGFNLAARKPIAIQYERFSSDKQVTQYNRPNKTYIINNELDILRNEIVTFHLIKTTKYHDLVVGFIDSPLRELATLILPELQDPHSEQAIDLPHNFLQLDQTDFPFMPTIYHLIVGLSTNVNHNGQNVTQVLSSVGGGPIGPFCTLPIDSPNSAMFLKSQDQYLFLLLSQDYTTLGKRNNPQCPADLRGLSAPHTDYKDVGARITNTETLGEVHVYLFHALENSSLLKSAYFDLYQTINLHAIDSFESFEYQGSSYALAVSRPYQKIYLLVLQGYSGFQIVSYIDAPGVNYVKVTYTENRKPVLIIYQVDGNYKLMESVIV